MNEPTVDIISCIYGDYDTVKECMNSWFPLPKNWNLYVYNSRVTEKNEIIDYLRERQKEFNFTFIDDGRTLRHSQAVKTLMNNTKSDWVLHLDSDLKILDRKFFDWANHVIKTSPNRVWGKIDSRHFTPLFQNYIDPTNYRMCLPRLCSWAVLFNRNFVVENKLEFSSMDLSVVGNLNDRTIPIKRIDDNNESQITLNLLGDVSWQFFWESYKQDVFGKIPDDAWEYLEHKNGSSRKWAAKNRATIIKTKNQLKIEFEEFRNKTIAERNSKIKELKERTNREINEHNINTEFLLKEHGLETARLLGEHDIMRAKLEADRNNIKNELVKHQRSIVDSIIKNQKSELDNATKFAADSISTKKNGA